MHTRILDENVTVNPLLQGSHSRALSETGSKQIYLANGLSVAYQEFGNPKGFPVIYFHSTGSSRLECRFFSRSAAKLGFRLIALDRPGIGKSDFVPHLDLNQFADIVVAAADKIGLDKFGLMSFATGGIFALTTAYRHPSRVVFQLSLGGIPGNLMLESSRRSSSYTASCMRSMLPPLVRVFTRMRHAFSANDSVRYIERLQDILCYTDRKILTDPRFMEILESSLNESVLQGSQGVARIRVCASRILDSTWSKSKCLS